MLNLEAARHTAVIGAPGETLGLLRALAVELSASPWGGTTVLAGFGSELPALLGNDLLSHLSASGETALETDDQPLLLSAEPLREVPRGFSAAVSACRPEHVDRHSGTWQIRMDGQTACLEPHGLRFIAQQMSDEQYAALLAAATHMSESAAAVAGDSVTDAPIIRVLGAPELVGTRGELKEVSKKARLTELAVYLYFNPDRDHHAMDEAIWPDVRVQASMRNSYVSRLRAWLGTASDGALYLPADGRYAYSPTMRCDWADFTDLAQVGLADRGPTGADALARCLALVQGQPFSGVDSRRYEWADSLKQRMIDTIVAVAHELASRQLAAGNPSAARAAALKGLLAEPSSEQLIRDQITALAVTKNIQAIKDLAERLARRAAQLEVELEPETAALLDRYLGGSG